MGDTGLEQGADSTGKRTVDDQGGAESGAVGAPGFSADSDVAALVAAWPTLSESVKASVLAIIKAGS
jgi:hypothetical protein